MLTGAGVPPAIAFWLHKQPNVWVVFGVPNNEIAVSRWWTTY